MGRPVVHFEIMGSDHAEHLGGSRLIGREQVTDGVQIGLFADPEGHVIGIIKGHG